jgi:Ser/Thr protein kinase RdoA (MazF antagonist)
MQFLDVRRLLNEIVDDELGLARCPRGFEFLHSNHTDIYRVRAAGKDFIAQLSSGSKAYLKRLRENLDRLAILEDLRIPRVVAWRASNGGALPGCDWAVLVYPEPQGHALGASNFSLKTWLNLCDLLGRVHELEGDSGPSTAPVFRFGDAAGFDAFGQALLVRIGDLPVRIDRVRAHLDHMAEYLANHAVSFRVPFRLIHGNLDRSNIIVGLDGVGLVDWAAMGTGDYAFDLAMLKFILDSVARRGSARLIREAALSYRARFQDDTLETRLRFFLPLAGLVHAYQHGNTSDELAQSRAREPWRCYLHSEVQWADPLRLHEYGEAVAPRRVA